MVRDVGNVDSRVSMRSSWMRVGADYSADRCLAVIVADPVAPHLLMQRLR